jgi:AmmeMemoRadiSam system protein B/AmmeMemoRadiSam system protein A
MIREAVAAGRYYPGSAEQLRDMIEAFVDENVEKEEVIGALMPHAGYPYSGPVAGAVVSRIAFKDTFIIMGPSHTGVGKPFSIMTSGKWRTPLGEVEIDAELAKKIVSISSYIQEDDKPEYNEHAVEVQVPFLQYFRQDVKIVPIILAYAPADAYKEIGQDIARAVKELNKEVVIIASGDMTHYEPQKNAEQKDGKAIEAMVELDEDELTRRFQQLNITMCAHGPAVCTISAARALGATRGELVKYQTSGDTTGDYEAVVGYAGIIFKAEKMHPLAALAKSTVETYVREGEIPKVPSELTPEMKEQAGVFVSIHKLGNLRGCIGTFEAQKPNVAAEIITNAISSSTRDPRFPPISPDELKDLDYSVDVLTTPKPVKDESELDAKRYGVIVESGWRKGLLLPDLEGVDTVEQQIDICRQKGGIGSDEPVKLYRFEVKRYK